MSHVRLSPHKHTPTFTQVQGEYGCKTCPHQRALGPFHGPPPPPPGQSSPPPLRRNSLPSGSQRPPEKHLFSTTTVQTARAAFLWDEDGQSWYHASAKSDPATIWILEPLLTSPTQQERIQGTSPATKGSGSCLQLLNGVRTGEKEHRPLTVHTLE